MQGHDRNDSSTNSSSSSELTTKKFYLSDELKQQIKDRAKSDYSGNASQLIRAAIHDHFGTLDGDGDRNVAHLIQEVSDLREKVDELVEVVDENTHTEGNISQFASLPAQETGSVPNSSASPTTAVEDGAIQRKIYSALEDAESDSLSLTELARQTGEPIGEVAAGAEELIENEILRMQQNTETHSYSINA